MAITKFLVLLPEIYHYYNKYYNKSYWFIVVEKDV